MTLKPHITYPNRRAYVLKVRSDAKSDALAGRLENIVTGWRRDFASGDELLDSLADDIHAAANEPPTSPKEPEP